MHARDVMVAPVTTVKPSTTVKEVAGLFPEERIGAAPVIDSQERLVGFISEGDLLQRVEARTERHHSWWLRRSIGNDTLAAEYVKSHGNGQPVGIVSRANLIRGRGNGGYARSMTI